jgi:hypothetical protein
VQIAPCGPLARAGLIQVVAQAGLTLAGVGDKPDVIFRNDVHFAPSSPGTPIQVGVQSDRVVIVVATPPGVSTWLAVHDLLGCLLDSLASPEARPRRAPLLYQLTTDVSVNGGPHTFTQDFRLCSFRRQVQK